jgi:hypothetical protein
VIRALAASVATYCAVVAVGAAAIGGGSLHTRNVGWVIVGAIAGLAAGFAGDRLALGAARGARWAAAVGGPFVVALALALAGTGESSAARWGAFVTTVAGAVLGALARERLGAVVRRRRG